METMKEELREKFPGLYSLMRPVKQRVEIEWRTLRYFRVKDLTRWLWPNKDLWQSELPIQQVRRYPVSGTFDSVLASVATADGGHARYLSPAAWRTSGLAGLRKHFPPDAGLKLVRQVGDFATGEYLSGTEHAHLQRKFLHGHPKLLLVANTLYLEGLGPRLYDVIEVALDDGIHVGYVSRHVGGRAPTSAEWQRGIAALKALQNKDLLSVVIPGGFSHLDFREPDCSGNAFVDSEGRFQYVDFQNFVLSGYAGFLDTIVMNAAERSHFGDKSILRGGRYLYQTVPGVDRPAKRDIAPRLETMRKIFAEAGLDLRGRSVFDIGCNIGMMIGSYLREGAAWCHGFDMPEIVPHTERVLLGTGCSRFSLTGGMLRPDRDLLADVPPWLKDGRTMVLSYLAVHGHIGWLNGLDALPWDTMIYEGHEGESEEMARGFIATLNEKIPCRVVTMTTYRDGDSDPRVLAIIERT